MAQADQIASGVDPALIGFRRLGMDDLPLMLRWLTTEHVKQWWTGEPETYEAVVAKYAPAISGQEPTESYLITYGAEAIGYIQTYVIAAYPEYAAAIGTSENAAGVDLFIGEPSHLHRGLGAPILGAFLRQIVFGQSDAESCLIAPEPANTAAIRAYEKVGFRYLKTIPVSGEPAPEYVMRLSREEIMGSTARRVRRRPRPGPSGSRAGSTDGNGAPAH